MSSFYEQLCNLFIRPIRQTYSDYDLGSFMIGQVGNRQNFTITSSKGNDIKGSFFKHKNCDVKTCILYLHSFNGSRLESLRFVPEIMEKGFHFLSFDFAGCGNSGGQYVSLGYNQRLDVLKVIQHVNSKYGIKQYFIWGRSMGAVAAIKFYSHLADQQSKGFFKDLRILGLVLDSAFISLKRLVVEVGRSRISIPQILIKAIFLMVGSSIEQRADFKVQQLQLEKDVQKIKCSTMLITSKQDTFINYTHSQDIFTHLKLHENKQIEYILGQHYENRDQTIVNTIYQFFVNKNKQKEHSNKMIGLKTSQIVQKHTFISTVRQQDLSIQKPSTSIRKYQQKKQPNSQKRADFSTKINDFLDKKTQSSGKIVLFRSNANEKSINNNISTQYKTLGSQKKISASGTFQPVQRNYNTEKKQSNSDHAQIKIVISSGNKEIRHKNQLRNKSKPNFVGKMIEVYTKQKPEQTNVSNQVDRKLDFGSQKSEEFDAKLQNQQNHCNVISDKLKKKTKIHKQKISQFQTIDRQDILEGISHCPYAEHVNKIKFGPVASPKVINFTISNGPIHPVTAKEIVINNCKTQQEVSASKDINRDRSFKKLSMTAQQYKNNQINMIKGVVNLSPNVKRKQEKVYNTELKIKLEGNQNREQRIQEQSKSMSNLYNLSYTDKANEKKLHQKDGTFMTPITLSHRREK